jgi:hypothetical protein
MRATVRSEVTDVAIRLSTTPLLPGIGTLRDLRRAHSPGSRSVRVAPHCAEADISAQHIAAARGPGMDEAGFLMMSHWPNPPNWPARPSRSSPTAPTASTSPAPGAASPCTACATVCAPVANSSTGHRTRDPRPPQPGPRRRQNRRRRRERGDALGRSLAGQGRRRQLPAGSVHHGRRPDGPEARLRPVPTSPLRAWSWSAARLGSTSRSDLSRASPEDGAVLIG